MASILEVSPGGGGSVVPTETGPDRSDSSRSPPGGSSGGFVGQQATFPSAQVNSGFLGGGYMGMGNGGYGPGGGSYITGADGGEGMFFNVFEAAPENEREGVGQPGGPGGPQGRVSGFSSALSLFARCGLSADLRNPPLSQAHVMFTLTFIS